MRTFTCCLILAIAPLDGAAQTRRPDTFQPARQIFARLFPADPRGRLRPPTLRTVSFERQRAANPECPGCAGRPGAGHFVLDSPRLTDTWLARHTYQANGGTYGDNAVVADFWYDAVHRRLVTRSLVLQEVEDPADLRLGRAPGSFPNDPDFSATLPAGETVGHVGFVRWTPNGFGAYFAAVQGAVRDLYTGYLDLSTVTGTSGTSRSGSRYGGEDLIKHVRLHPSGQLEVGFDTDPDARPDPALLVRGSVEVEGALTVAGVPVGAPAPAPVCSVRTATTTGRNVSAACDAGQLAMGGGGVCASGEMRGSRPLTSGDSATGWELSCSREAAHTTYVICCSR